VVLDIIFFLLVHLHLVLTTFPFPVSTAEFIGEFWANKRNATSDVAPTNCRYIECVIGAMSLPALKGEAVRLRCASRRSAANSQRLKDNFRGFFSTRCASPISGERIAAPIVMAQHKENERIDGYLFAALRLLL
jgi:hypothetical protein